MNSQDKFEKAILKVIRDGKGEYGWYIIEMRLSILDVPRDINLMDTLKELEKRGLITSIPRETHGKWELTEQGNILLDHLES
jgi:DNA-binding PadR family transcriptional regulator